MKATMMARKALQRVRYCCPGHTPQWSAKWRRMVKHQQRQSEKRAWKQEVD